MPVFVNPRPRLFAGAVLISFSPVFVTLVSVPPTASAFYRVLIGGASLTLVWVFVTRESLPRGRAAAALAAAAAFFALDLWFWHRSILYIGPGRSTLLANLQVFFMMAAGAVLFAERPGRRQWFAAAAAIAGLAILLAPAWRLPGPQFRVGVALGLLTAASYAGYLICLRVARTARPAEMPVPEVAIVSLAAAVALGVAARADGSGLAVTVWADAGWLAAYGLLSHAGGVMLIAGSIARVAPAEAGIALLLQPALSFGWEVLFFGRALTMIEAGGAALTLAAIFFGSVRTARR